MRGVELCKLTSKTLCERSALSVRRSQPTRCFILVCSWALDPAQGQVWYELSLHSVKACDCNFFYSYKLYSSVRA